MNTDEKLERDYVRLCDFLKKVLGRLRMLRAVEGSILILAGAAIVFLTGASSLAVKSFLPYAPFLVSIASLALFASLVVFTSLRVLRVPSLSTMAREVEKTVPDLRDDLTNSLALFHSAGADARDRELSRSLVAAQMARTSRQVSSLSPRQIIKLNRVTRYAKLFVPVAFVFVFASVLSPSSLVESWNLLARPWASLPPRVTYLDVTPKDATLARGSSFLITASTWGKIPEEMSLRVWAENGRESVTAMERSAEGKFRYLLRRVDESFRYQASSRGFDSPVYRANVVPLPEVAEVRLTSFPPDYSRLPPEVQTGGHLSALKGTVVKMSVTTTKEVSEGNIVLSGTELVPLQKREDSTLEGSLVLLSEGSYHLALKDEFGFSNPSPLRYRIHLVPDEVPRVEIVHPARDQEVVGNETLALVYNAGDDFGITELRLGFRLAGKKEQKTTLWKGSAEKKFTLRGFRWDLDDLALAPGDRVDYWLEVVDNDTISGPKEGYSQTFSLIVKDLLKRVTEQTQGIKEIADALVDLLADHLESSAGEPSQRNLTKKELAGRARDILKQVDDNLAKLKKGRDRADPVKYDLEMLQRHLAATVDRMEKQEPEAITSQLERIALLAEDIAKRARMEDAQALAQDIRNRQRRLLSRLEELKNNLTEEGKEEALQELARLRERINKLMNALTQLADRLPDDFINSDALKDMDFQNMFQGLEEIAKKLKEGDLEGALQAARGLLQSLGQMLAAMSQGRMEAQMGDFGRLGSEMRTNEGELSKIIAEQQEVLLRTEDLNGLLGKRQEFFDLERLGELGEDALIESPEALMEVFDLEASDLLTADEKERLTELARREKSLQERTRAIKERLELLSQIFPIMDPRLAEDIGQASEFMGQAQGRLGRHDPPGAIPPEREALERLTKSQQGMRALSQQMARRAGRFARRLAWGYAPGYTPWAGWYPGGWPPLPTLPQPGLKGFRQEQGYTGIQREEFPTPPEDAHQVPGMYREEIMKALKEGYPSEYRKQVKKYFQNLAE